MGKLSVSVIKGDITQLNVDVIVNAAKSTLLGGGGVDGAIHLAAGPELLETCRKLNGCEVGQMKQTPGFNLPATHVFHTVGPIYTERTFEVERNLRSCYETCLNAAIEQGLTSIAFPNVSTGIYGYPKDEALANVKIVIDELRDKGVPHDLNVVFCCFDDENYLLYQEAFK